MCERCDRDKELIQAGWCKINVPRTKSCECIEWCENFLGDGCKFVREWDFLSSNVGVDFYFKEPKTAVAFKLYNSD